MKFSVCMPIKLREEDCNRFRQLLSLSSIPCRNEYLALLTKRTRLYFLVAKFQDILRMSSPLKSA